MRCTWRQRDGQPVALQNMHSAHIVNCIKLIRRGEWRRKEFFSGSEWIAIFTAEILKRIRRNKM